MCNIISVKRQDKPSGKVTAVKCIKKVVFGRAQKLRLPENKTTVVRKKNPN